jgi:pimeloyl-ACP methyl ester carboxylesterase
MALPDWAGEHEPSSEAPGSDSDAMPESLVVPVDTGERIHFLDWGVPHAKHALPLVLVHELSQTSWAWAPVARRLAASRRVVAVDLRGHGLSEVPRSGYDLESLATDVLTVAVANGWGAGVAGPRIVIAGHGPLGGAVAAIAALVEPESVAGVALIDGGWEPIGDLTSMSASEYVSAVAEPPEVLASMDAYLSDRRGFDPSSWDADQDRAARAQVDQKHAGHVAMVARPMVIKATVDGLFRYRPDEVLPSIGVPLLLVAATSGSADDEDARDRALARDDVTAARLANGNASRVVTLQGGHNLMRYQARALSAELAALAAVAWLNTPAPARQVEGTR